MKRPIWILLVLLLAVSCGTTIAPNPTAVPTSKPIPTGAGSAGPVVIEVERTGGIAGTLQWWKVYASGQVQMGPQAATYQFPPEDVSNMVDQVIAAGFFDLENAYGTSSSCRDCFSTKITVTSGGKIKTVAIVEGAAGVPPEVTAVFTQVMSWLSNIPQ